MVWSVGETEMVLLKTWMEVSLCEYGFASVNMVCFEMKKKGKKFKRKETVYLNTYSFLLIPVYTDT